MLIEEVRDVVRHRLRVGRRARPAHEDPLIDPGDLVGDAVGDVHACARCACAPSTREGPKCLRTHARGVPVEVRESAPTMTPPS